ncbi:MAG: leucine-rich repeat domain-containing protein, partial [Ureaplasma sp.]|nr:leucine-rich repeat domain-containing protein [Ureaplasma sp.]
LEKINLPSTIKFIGNAAFKNCSKLKSIKIANGIDNDFSKLIISEIPQSCFEGCSLINNLKFAQNIKEPQNFAFKDCTSLNSITFGNNPTNDWRTLSWTRINESVFENTGAFERILLPQNLNSIDKRAFAKSKIRFYSLNQTTNNKNNKLKFIGDEAFYGCTNFVTLFSVFSPDKGDKDGFINTSLESIGNRAFMNSKISFMYTPYPVGQKKYDQLFFNTEKTFTIGSSCFENAFFVEYGPNQKRNISTNYVIVYPNWKFLGTNTFKNSEACILLNYAQTELPNYSYLEENFCDGWMGELSTVCTPKESFEYPNGVIYFKYNNPSTSLTSEKTKENNIIGKIMKKTFSNCTTSTLKEKVLSNNESIVIGWPKDGEEIW